MPLTSFDKDAAAIKKTVLANKGKSPTTTPGENTGLLSAENVKKNLLLGMKQAVSQADSLRGGSKDDAPIDLSLEQFVNTKFGFGSTQSFYDALGVNPSHQSMESLSNMSDFNEGYRWLLPEIVRDAVRLGLRRAPNYPSWIAAEENVTNNRVVLPHVNMSAATPEFVNETETIPVGSVSFGEKDVRIRKIGTGLKISDEVQAQVSLNILSLYLQDAGVKLGLGLDTMAVDVLLNGETTDGAYSAPLVGCNAVGPVQYIDLLRAWIRMGRLGRLPSGMLSNEDAALGILQLDEFKGANYNNTKQNINLKTPIPQSQDYMIHGAFMSGNRVGLIDKTAALLKLNATALKVESERIAERQLNGTYVTISTGFAKLFRDAFLVIDGTQTIGAAPFPSWMDIGAAENVIIS